MTISICECGDHAWKPITKGFVALVSPEDQVVLNLDWHATVNRKKRVYVRRNLPRQPGKRPQECLHRTLVKPKRGNVVDHKNLNGLDNRRENLRECTEYQNRLNRSVQQGKHIPLKGVQKRSARSFKARITVNKKPQYLGTFPTAALAHEAYVNASKALHGEFGRAS